MRYFKQNPEALQHEKDRLERKATEWGNNAPMLYPQPGSTMIRILPPFSEAGVFFRKIVKHRVPVGKSAETFACPASEANLPCAICVMGQHMTDSRDEEQMKFAKENLRPREHYLYNVLVHSGPANRKAEVPEFGKVYVMESGIMVHRQIIELDQDPANGWADVTNLEGGVNLIIKRTGQGFDTKYTVNPHGAGRTNVFEDCAARGIDPQTLELINLDEVYTIPDQEKVAEVASRINVSMFGAAPSPRPALQTVSPVAAAATPAAPTPGAAPVPVAATPVAPTPQAQPVGAAVPTPQAQPVGTAVPTTNPVSTPTEVPGTVNLEAPQPPAVPAPPTE